MSTTILKMPKFGESIVEGTIGRWLKQPGEWIERDEPLVEIQTDKVNAEVPSPLAGVVQQLLLPVGATAAVGTDIAVIGEAPAATAAPDPPAAPEPTGSASTVMAALAPNLGRGLGTPQSSTIPASRPLVGQPEHVDQEPAAPAGPWHPGLHYTPVVLRLAQENGLDLGVIEGSGLGGRVTRKDVERALALRRSPPAPPRPNVTRADSTSPPADAPLGSAYAGPGAQSERRPLTPMRRAIADHMARARRDIPDAWATVEIDVTGLATSRQKSREEGPGRKGHEFSYLPYFVEAVVGGLRAVPHLNATWAGDHILVHQEYHLGIAVSLEQGLVVPVLRNAERLNIGGLTGALSALVTKARSGRLSRDDLQGATFSVNNVGALGSVLSQPVVPLGQAGIVTMEAVVKRPVVISGDVVAVRSMMNCCLSFDHRVVDGAEALHFLRAVKGHLEAKSERP